MPNSNVNLPFSLSCFATLFQTVGFVLPWWLIIGQHIFLGLCFFLICWSVGGIHDGSCIVLPYTDVGNSTSAQDALTIKEYNAFFNIIRGVAAASLSLSISSTVTLYLIKQGRNKKSNYVAARICLILSALIFFGLTGYFGYIIGIVSMLLSQEIGVANFPWSVFLSGVGGLCSFAAFISLCSRSKRVDSGPNRNTNAGHLKSTQC